MSASDSEDDLDLRDQGKIKIIVKKQTADDDGVVIVAKTTTPFAKIFKGYEQKLGVERHSFVFAHEGNTIAEGGDEPTTPKMLEMMAGKCYVVEAMVKQVRFLAGDNIARVNISSRSADAATLCGERRVLELFTWSWHDPLALLGHHILLL
ncbi:hypothetical protein P7C73_g400, partial [Tremellales sp. Uapishka_1]